MSVLHPEVLAPTLDPRDPALQLAALLDPGTCDLMTSANPACGALAAVGLADGVKVVAFCTDARRMGGALGAAACRVITEAIDAAVELDRPIIGLWHSGGATLNEGV